MPDANVGHRLAALLAAVLEGDVAAHLDDGLVEADARRIDQHILNGYVRAGTDQGRRRQKRSRTGVAGHRDRTALEHRLALQRDDAPFWPGFDGDLRSQKGEHFFGVVAGRLAFDHGGLARRAKPRQQNRRLHLGRRHRQPVADRDDIGGAPQGQRQGVLIALGDGEPHRPQRFQHPSHRTARQRRIAGEPRLDRMACHDPGHQPRAGAGIAEIQRLGW